ncbi:MAG: malonic semialdehyde reductase [Rhodospirillales bacterium]
MADAIDSAALDRLFFEARTHNSFRDEALPKALLDRIYEVARMAPTSANCLPMRVVYVVSQEAKEKLRPTLMEGNVEKTMAAPATAIIGHDLEFYEHLPTLFPHTDARAWFVGKPAHIETTAVRNGSLQGGYFILAARALGLDCGPMSGFDNAKVDEAFFPGGTVKSNFLCNLGYGDGKGLHPRGPRLSPDQACQIV